IRGRQDRREQVRASLNESDRYDSIRLRSASARSSDIVAPSRPFHRLHRPSTFPLFRRRRRIRSPSSGVASEQRRTHYERSPRRLPAVTKKSECYNRDIRTVRIATKEVAMMHRVRVRMFACCLAIVLLPLGALSQPRGRGMTAEVYRALMDKALDG